MKHIPHVVPPTLKLHDEFVNFPKMYENEPLKGCGFYCDIDYPIYYKHLNIRVLWLSSF